MLSKQIHEISARELESDFDNEYTQMTKLVSFGQLIPFVPISIQMTNGKKWSDLTVSFHM